MNLSVFCKLWISQKRSFTKKIGAKLQFQQRFGGACWAGGRSSHNSMFSLYHYYYSDAEIIPVRYTRPVRGEREGGWWGTERSKDWAKIVFIPFILP